MPRDDFLLNDGAPYSCCLPSASHYRQKASMQASFYTHLLSDPTFVFIASALRTSNNAHRLAIEDDQRIASLSVELKSSRSFSEFHAMVFCAASYLAKAALKAHVLYPINCVRRIGRVRPRQQQDCSS